MLSCATNRSPDYQKAALLKAEAQHCPGNLPGGVKVRTHCFYQSVIARAIENRRPHMQGCSVALEAIAEALAGFDPHAVVCSRPRSEYLSGGRGVWVELPADPTLSGDNCRGGDNEGFLNPDLTKLLSILDEAQERLRLGDLPESC